MQALMLLTIGLQRGWYNSIAVYVRFPRVRVRREHLLIVDCSAPPIVAVIIFKIFLTRRFDEKFKW